MADVVHAAQQGREVPPPGASGSLKIDNHALVKGTDKGRMTTSKSPPTPVRPPAAASAPVAAATPGTGAAGADAAVEVAAAPGSEAQWKETAARARKRVADDKARVAELEAATKKLENDFYAWDDGQYRDRVIKPSWDHSKSELEDARRELVAAEADLADLPEKARKAGALPGWIRE